MLLIQRQIFARRTHAIQISGIFWINIYDLWRHSAGSFPMAHWLFINHGSTCSQQSHWSRKTQRWTYVHLHVQALPCRCSIWDSSLDDSTYTCHMCMNIIWPLLGNVLTTNHQSALAAPVRPPARPPARRLMYRVKASTWHHLICYSSRRLSFPVSRAAQSATSGNYGLFCLSNNSNQTLVDRSEAISRQI